MIKNDKSDTQARQGSERCLDLFLKFFQVWNVLAYFLRALVIKTDKEWHLNETMFF
jgi:hypothetical protein